MVLTVGWTALTDIYRHIQHPSFDDPYQFGLGERRALEMQATDDTFSGKRLVILHKHIGNSCFLEAFFVVILKKIASFVVIHVGFDK